LRAAAGEGCFSLQTVDGASFASVPVVERGWSRLIGD